MTSEPFMIELTYQRIQPDKLLAEAMQASAGAVLLFLGVTREFTAGRQTIKLDYEAYGEMAQRELQRLRDQAMQDWQLIDCKIVHRLGEVPLAEASVAIVVVSPHRKEAFAAGEWLIDRLKETVPIWKCEHWADGTTQWVHPSHAAPNSN